MGAVRPLLIIRRGSLHIAWHGRRELDSSELPHGTAAIILYLWRSLVNSCMILCLPQNNEARDTEYCVLNEEFRDSVTEADGFEWRNDQAPDRTPKVRLWHGRDRGS